MMNEGFMLVHMHIGSGKDNLLVPLKKLYTNVAILYHGQNLTESQCSSSRSGVT